MDNTEITNNSFMFENFTDEQFNAWLAGFFDGEGCIYIPKTFGIELSISNTNRMVIESIQRRLNLGIITETKFSQENWKTKYSWRVRTYDEALIIINKMRPFLIIKAKKADEALQVIDRVIQKRKAIQERNESIIEFVKNNPNVSQKQVAEHFQMHRSGVTQVLTAQGIYKSPVRKEIFGIRETVQNHKKNKINPKTTTKIIHKSNPSKAIKLKP